MATKVLDSWALMAFFMDQPAAEEVEAILLKGAEGKHLLLLSAVNWGEIYYSVMKSQTAQLADLKAQEIASLPIQIIPIPEDLRLVRQAAIYKATKKMSYADCFAAALAKVQNAELVTGDREFREVEKEIRVHWLV